MVLKDKGKFIEESITALIHCLAKTGAVTYFLYPWKKAFPESKNKGNLLQ